MKSRPGHYAVIGAIGGGGPAAVVAVAQGQPLWLAIALGVSSAAAVGAIYGWLGR